MPPDKELILLLYVSKFPTGKMSLLLALKPLKTEAASAGMKNRLERQP